MSNDETINGETDNDDAKGNVHKPVMLKEALELLDLKPGKVIVDCTVGGGGHSREILKRITPGGFLIGIDKDEEILRETYNSFLADDELCNNRDGEQSNNNFAFYQSDYEDIEEIINRAGKGRVDGVLLDLGVSSMQLEQPDRGFSFNREGPLDMRMDRSGKFTAYDMLRKISVKELEYIIRTYGEERFAGRIARAVVEQRGKFGCTKTTTELARLIKYAVPFTKKKIHPATLTFQALRIVVNNELNNLEKFLNCVHKFLKEGGRIVAISFHSLEDRIVKNSFKDMSTNGVVKILTPKPLRASKYEVEHNPRSRSAKLRASERVFL